jgi:hypothetical protein
MRWECKHQGTFHIDALSIKLWHERTVKSAFRNLHLTRKRKLSQSRKLVIKWKLYKIRAEYIAVVIMINRIKDKILRPLSFKVQGFIGLPTFIKTVPHAPTPGLKGRRFLDVRFRQSIQLSWWHFVPPNMLSTGLLHKQENNYRYSS